MDDAPAGSNIREVPQRGNAAAPPVRHPGSGVTLFRGGLLVLIFGLLATIFTLLMLIVLRADLQPTTWDQAVTHEIQEIPSVPWGVVLVAVSLPGFSPWNWIIGAAIVLFMLWKRWYVEAVFTVFAGSGGLLAEIIKPLVDRPRPTPDLAQIATVLHSPSFPSGHTTRYVCLYGFLLYLSYTLLPKRPLRYALVTLFALAVLLVGPSRVYMGQHWASDAMAGYALGFAYLLLIVELYRAWYRRHPKAPETSVKREM